MRILKPWRVGLALFLLVLFVRCGGDSPTTTDPPPVDPPVATTVTVSPASAMLSALGETVQLTATVLDQRGQAMSGVTVTWASSDGAVASVGANGVVTAVTNGSASVTATVGNASGSATVTVSQQAANVSVSPDAVTLSSVGDTVRMSAEAFDSRGNAIADAGFLWSTDDGTVASVDASGLVTAVRSGSASITATSGTASGDASVEVLVELAGLEVTPADTTLFSLGDTLQLTVQGLDANGNLVPGVSVTWSSEDDAVAEVDMTGLVTALKTGSVNIVAMSGNLADSAAVTVAQLAARVVVTPAVDTLNTVGDMLQLTAMALDANGNLVEDTEYIWEARHPHVVTVDNTGLVTATGKGSGTIRVKATRAGGNRVGDASITVLEAAGGDVASASQKGGVAHPGRNGARIGGG